MSDRIRVIVCIPSISMRREMRVSPRTMIQDLKRSLPDPDCELVFAGSTLLETVPLGFYPVNDGDFMVAVSKDQRVTCAWAHITEDYEVFNDRMRCRRDPKVAPELARLKDIRMTRLMSAKPSAFARCSAAFAKPKRELPQDETVMAAPALQPSVEPIPVPWA